MKLARRDELMAVQQQVAFDFAQSMVGDETPVVIDAADPEFPGHHRGRTYADSPEIDCLIRVKGKNLAAPATS